MPFVYYPDALKILENGLTMDRMTTYLIETKGDLNKAIRLYEHNTRLCEALYGVLQGFEISLRNSMHGTMKTEIGHSDWYDHIAFNAKEAKSISDAKDNLRRWGKTITSGRVIAELTFGFWVRLTAPEYEKLIWVTHLYKAFPGWPKPDRLVMFGKLEQARKLRNRVAHHEPIFKKNLLHEYNQILEVVKWICPTTAMWLGSHNTFVKSGFCRSIDIAGK